MSEAEYHQALLAISSMTVFVTALAMYFVPPTFPDAYPSVLIAVGAAAGTVGAWLGGALASWARRRR